MNSSCCLLAQTEKCCEKKACGSFLVFSGAYFRALFLVAKKKFKGKHKSLLGSRGCLGCCTKPPFIIAVDEPSRGLRIQGQKVKKPRKSKDFWSTSTFEMDNSTVQSQKSISSISTSNQPVDPTSSTGGTSNSNEFVNHGLLLWNQTRQQWVGEKGSRSQQQVREPRISWNATYESLLGTNKPFAQPIPLSEMIDFLVGVWEQEGSYD